MADFVKAYGDILSSLGYTCLGGTKHRKWKHPITGATMTQPNKMDNPNFFRDLKKRAEEGAKTK